MSYREEKRKEKRERLVNVIRLLLGCVMILSPIIVMFSVGVDLIPNWIENIIAGYMGLIGGVGTLVIAGVIVFHEDE